MPAAGNFPRHRTIRDSRALHLQELSELFVQVVKVAQELGLIKLAAVASEGTKVAETFSNLFVNSARYVPALGRLVQFAG